MSRMFKTIVPAMLFCLCVTANSTLRAQDVGNDNSPQDGERDQSWYQPARDQSDTRAIIREKARRRAEQREARLEAIRWYQKSSPRPTISPLYGDMGPWFFIPLPPGQVSTYGPWISIASSNGQGPGQTGANSGWTANRPIRQIR